MSTIKLSQVLHRNIQHPLHVVQASDFTCTNPIIVTDAVIKKMMPVLPYALEPKSRQVLYSAKVDLKASLESTFLYDYLRRNSEYILSVDFNHGNLNQLKNFKIPTFIFSTGRCGSTLLSKIIKNHNLISISEPDFYTQLSTIPSQILGANERLFLFNHLSADLVSAYTKLNSNNGLFIKLRAECNALPQLYINNKQQKTVFISRNFSSWAKSVLGHFNTPQLKAETIVRFYINALKTLNFLSQNSKCLHLRYEDLIDYKNNSTIQLLNQILSTPIDIHQLASAMELDSQLGSEVDKTKKMPIDQKFLADCIKLFKKNVPKQLMENFQLSID